MEHENNNSGVNHGSTLELLKSQYSPQKSYFSQIEELEKASAERIKAFRSRIVPVDFSPAVLEIKDYYQNKHRRELQLLENMIKQKEKKEPATNEARNNEPKQATTGTDSKNKQVEKEENSELKITKIDTWEKPKGVNDKSPLLNPKLSLINEEMEASMKPTLEDDAYKIKNTIDHSTISSTIDYQNKDKTNTGITQQLMNSQKTGIENNSIEQSNSLQVSDLQNNSSSQFGLQQPAKVDAKESQKPKIKRPNSASMAKVSAAKMGKSSEVSDSKPENPTSLGGIDTVNSIVIEKETSQRNTSQLPSGNNSGNGLPTSFSPFQFGMNQPFGGGFGGFGIATLSTLNINNNKSLVTSDTEQKKSNPIAKTNPIQQPTGKTNVKSMIDTVKEIDDDFPDF